MCGGSSCDNMVAGGIGIMTRYGLFRPIFNSRIR